jgi:hypothetical protein
MPKTLLANSFYWFHKPANKKLIISGHGRAPAGSEKKLDWPPPSAGAPALWVCSQPKKDTNVQVAHIIGLNAGLAAHVMPTLKARGFQACFFPKPTEVWPNYYLTKFAGGKDPVETHRDYETWSDQYGFDIVSPRKGYEVRFQTIFDQPEIQQKKYEHVYCSFCRS